MNRNRAVIIELVNDTSIVYDNIIKKLNFKNSYHINSTHNIISNLRIIEPDFIIVDVAMLEEDFSLNLLDMLSEYRRDIPLIIVSSIFIPGIIKTLKLFPYSEFLLKPLNLTKFSNSVNKLCSQKIIWLNKLHKSSILSTFKTFMMHLIVN